MVICIRCGSTYNYIDYRGCFACGLELIENEVEESIKLTHDLVDTSRLDSDDWVWYKSYMMSLYVEKQNKVLILEFDSIGGTWVLNRYNRKTDGQILLYREVYTGLFRNCMRALHTEKKVIDELICYTIRVYDAETNLRASKCFKHQDLLAKFLKEEIMLLQGDKVELSIGDCE